ncbi:MAG: tRNA (adenosine(37)-N6)-threonylcarbamoyltransferase complex dimerization subunit type 1 TsaB [Deltaproteobacteria bacterium]|nr:tRNA (adenosine(37)-N6)-threonylcarbamoyltransferase complex dimerization subunit type 1 TsaB [Deltaproteobacteria bacterium]
MKLLAIDTTTSLGSMALAELSEQSGVSLISSDQYWAKSSPGETHSEQLLPRIQALLQKAEWSFESLGAFAATVGPGAFTGVRITLATLKGIAAVIDRPIIPLSSLEILAHQAFAYTDAEWVSPILDARKGEIYAALYDRAGLLEGPLACHPEVWRDFLHSRLNNTSRKKGLLAGTGLLSYRPVFEQDFPLPPGHEDEESLHLYYPLAKFSIALIPHKLRQEGNLLPASLVTPIYIRSVHQ